MAGLLVAGSFRYAMGEDRVVGELTARDYEHLLSFRTALRRFLAVSADSARAVGLTPAQHQLLLAVKGHPGTEDPSVGDLAGYLLVRHHSAVGLVDRTAKLGLVRRRREGRTIRVVLTARGERCVRQLSEVHVDELARLAPLLRYVPPEREAPTTTVPG